MARIELDEQDCGSVQRAREALAKSEAMDTGAATVTDLLMDIGRLRAALGIVLRIVDGGESS